MISSSHVVHDVSISWYYSVSSATDNFHLEIRHLSNMFLALQKFDLKKEKLELEYYN